MGLYHLYSHSVEIKYKSYFLSKATLFTLLITALNIILPFIVAYRSRGFWLKSHSFYEQPVVRPTYEYLLVATTLDPSEFIICGDATNLKLEKWNDDNCAETQIQDYDYNADGRPDMLHFQFALNVPPKYVITSIVLILGIDLQLQTTCEMHMQALATINRQFTIPPSRFYYIGDLEFYQKSHLPCLKNVIDTSYNTSLFNIPYKQGDFIEYTLQKYFKRTAITQVKTLFSNSHTGNTEVLNIIINLEVPEMNIRYQPSIMQELKWAWPQYLSLVAIFYWLFNQVKKFVFNKRLLMAWEVVPWK
ncbi:transmembrane protein 231-like [Papilio machaon]|uniref:transmembrane protein 231-like n=1 Tax=Papilio machaon TaxID=76193 RepID=UPI001E662B2D|nr:transmembrane protein 231-like [Papilio machaon]